MTELPLLFSIYRVTDTIWVTRMGVWSCALTYSDHHRGRNRL